MPKNEEVSLASLGIQMPYSMQAVWAEWSVYYVRCFEDQH